MVFPYQRCFLTRGFTLGLVRPENVVVESTRRREPTIQQGVRRVPPEDVDLTEG